MLKKRFRFADLDACKGVILYEDEQGVLQHHHLDKGSTIPDAAEGGNSHSIPARRRLSVATNSRTPGLLRVTRWHQQSRGIMQLESYSIIENLSVFESYLEKSANGTDARRLHGLRYNPLEPPETVSYEYLFGTPSCAAVYWEHEAPRPRELDGPERYNHVDLLELQKLLQAKSLCGTKSAENIIRSMNVNQELATSAMLLGRMSEYYTCYLPEATISMRMLTDPIHTWPWVKAVLADLAMAHNIMTEDTGARHAKAVIAMFLGQMFPKRLDRAQVFACILQFETGTIGVDSDVLRQVMAISSGNSLFVARPLLHDPGIQDYFASDVVEHVVGNVGKPGISLLVPPAAPEISRYAIEHWHISAHSPFDGQTPTGLFHGTSLHLSLTGFESPVSLKVSGFRANQAYFLESRISMLDGSRWIADLDIMKALANDDRVTPLSGHNSSCGHDQGFSNAIQQMTSIDCWEEYVDRPDGIVVVRAAGSWMARLGAISIASTRNEICKYIHPGSLCCWTCVVDSMVSSDTDNCVIVQ